jgi:hypothetical protein
MFYRIAADIVLACHWMFVLFVVGGLILILLGGCRGWSWVRYRWWRLLHLVAIAIVVLQSWWGVICPLTNLEKALRERGGQTAYEGSFIGHWMSRWLYYEAPLWVFAVVYTMFGALVVASWFLVRPNQLSQRRKSD